MRFLHQGVTLVPVRQTDCDEVTLTEDVSTDLFGIKKDARAF